MGLPIARGVSTLVAALILARTAAAACPPDCVAGGGPSSPDCLLEWGGIASATTSCTDGDPTCDQDAAIDGTCTIPLQACLGVDAACPVTGPATAKVTPKKLRGAAALAGAIDALAPGTCTPPGFPVAVKRSLRGPAPLKAGKARLAVTVAADGTKDPDVLTLACEPGRPSFTNVVQPILTAHCATVQCHVGGSSAQSGLDLSAGVAYAAVVGVPATEKPGARLVVPGNVRRSFLATKLFGKKKVTKMPLGCGTPDLPCLTDAETYTILAWIQAGAPAD